MHFLKNILTLGCLALLVLPLSIAGAQQTSEESSEDVTARVVDGKVVIRDGKGNVRVFRLDSGDAEGVIVLEQDEAGDDENADRNTFVRRGRAILIGPEGQQEVVELDNLDESASMTFQFDTGEGLILGGGEGQWMVSPQDMMLQLDGSAIGFRIGVSCDEIGEGLKAQLRLDHGLLVEEVIEDSPAEAADVRKFDILIEANGTSLNEVNELVQAVQEAGESESDVEIKAVRRGDEVTITITPEKREGAGIVVGGQMDRTIPLDLLVEGSDLDLESGDVDVQLRRVLPGIIQGRGAVRAAQSAAQEAETAALKAEIAELRAMIEQLSEQLRNK